MNKPAKKKVPLFENLSFTPQLAEGHTLFSAFRAFFSKPKTTVPGSVLPSVKTDLKTYYSKKPSLTWFGHSSYLIHCDGINILVDPVLSGYASPFSFTIKAFKGTDIYKPADMPPVDWLILTHNHYDHLDIHALQQLAGKTKAYILPSGVSGNLESLHIKPDQLTELGWWQSTALAPGMTITSTPARHFSGRGIRRNGTLWSSYFIAIDGYKIFIGGDSGYDDHFKEIGNRFGPFDLAVLECGQYNTMWPYIHSMPEELVPEAIELKAKVVMPVHWGKFSLAMHDWKEPVTRFIHAADKAGLAYTTPLIGEPVIIDEYYPRSKLWEEL
jgi:L-ascorbate metabolism protein UlaG (beta-lactamase superfamily)